MTIPAEPFHGLPCQRIENAFLQVDYFTTVGPRIVRLRLRPSQENLLADLPDEVIETPRGALVMHGGHRLWHAPEDNPRTYIPDDRGLTVEEAPGGVRLTGPVEAETGIQKTMELNLDPDRSVLTVRHSLQNRGIWPVELAPWAITQLPMGGMVILPEPDQPADPHGLLPNRHLVLWPYARWSDPRLKPGEGYVLLSADAILPPVKVGLLTPKGWIGYLREGVLLVKRFDPQVDRLHPDQNCNIETYCKDIFVEAETLGPLTHLEPEQTVVHTERWEVFGNIHVIPSIEGIQGLVKTLEL